MIINSNILFFAIIAVNKQLTMLQVGITGGIGSGKTTVCKIFETLGIPIYYADDRAKALMIENQTIVSGLKNLFGKEVYTADGALNRPYLANIVFNDKSKLEQLNAIVHPAVFLDGYNWHQAQKDVPYTIKEAALLFEAGSYKAMDKLITVFAPKDVRLERVIKRDKTTKEAIEARMDKQWSDEKKVELADFVIHNYDEHLLIPQVLKIHRELSENESGNENES